MFLGLPLIWSQRHGMGLIPDSISYRRTKVVASLGAKYRISDSLSLRKYCPTPRNQFETSTCVGWAVGYGALTICHAIQDNITDTATLNNKAHSALFLYNSIKSHNNLDCNEAMRFDIALDFLKQSGDCTVKLMPNNINNCKDTIIPKRAKEEAQNYRIKDFAAVFDIDTPAQERIRKVCQMIHSNNPVIIGLQMTKSFEENGIYKKTWSLPKEDSIREGFHALVLIGYNIKSKTFEAMNSWGEEWGDGGFITFSFDAFEKYVQFAYVLTPNDRIQVSGELNCQRQSDTVRTKFNEERRVYELVSPLLTTGSIFQLTSSNVPKGKYVYAFSVDAGGKTMIIYPFSPNDYSPIMSFDAQTPIPAVELGIEISKKGENALVVLYSDLLIGDFDKRVKNMERHTKSNIQTKLNKAFGDIFIDQKKIEYDKNTMKLKSLSEYGQGFVAPLVLMIEG